MKLTTKDIQEARRLGTCLDSQMVPLKQIREFLSRIEQKGETPSVLPRRKKASGVKQMRKDFYKQKLRTA